MEPPESPGARRDTGNGLPAILLTGPKHSGKTSAGRALAGLWGCGFTDLDELIERQTGKSPRTLFKEGAGVFRAAEAEALERFAEETGRAAPEDTASPKPRIAAAGGGLIDNPGAMGRLAKARNIKIIYLEVSPETAWERIRRASEESGELPPFLNTADPRGSHFELHRRRAEGYRKIARHTVNAEGKSPARIAREISRLIRFQNEGDT